MQPNVTSWSPAAAPDSALVLVLRALKARWPLVLVVTATALVASYLVLDRKSLDYQATAQVLITPLPQYDETFFGLDLVRDSGDPERTAQTASALLASPETAAAVARRLGNGLTTEEVTRAVVVEAQGESNVLGVSATAKDPELAASMANAFARLSASARRVTLQRQLGARIDQLRDRRDGLDTDDRESRLGGDLAEQINELEAIRGAKTDPTLTIAQLATVPSAPQGAAPWLVMLLAGVAGLVLGTVAAVVVGFFNRRLRGEDEVLALYPLPVLTRVPPLPWRLRSAQLKSPLAMPSGAREAFRTLRAQLERGAGARRAVMLASASAGDGKTTAAANLAVAFADAGHSVIAVDFDLRKPELAKRLGIVAERGFASLLTAGAELPDLLVDAPGVPGLRVLPAVEGDAAFLEALIRRMPEVLARAQDLADYVVIDTAPLGEVGDALRVAAQIDEIILVARPGHTDRGNLEQVRDLLERADARPVGLLITGQALRASSTQYTYGAPAGARA